MKLLAKKPEDRFQSARELATLLAKCPAASRWGVDEARAWWEEHRESEQILPETVQDQAATATLVLPRANLETV